MYAKPSPQKKMHKTSTGPSSSSHTESGRAPVEDSNNLIAVEVAKGLDAIDVVVAVRGNTAKSDAKV